MYHSKKKFYPQRLPEAPGQSSGQEPTSNRFRKKYSVGDWIWMTAIFLAQVTMFIFIVKSFAVSISIKDWGVLLLLDLLITKDALKPYRKQEEGRS